MEINTFELNTLEHANNQNNIIRSSMHNYYIITILIILTLLILRLIYCSKYTCINIIHMYI